jgi:hypothetical protein
VVHLTHCSKLVSFWAGEKFHCRVAFVRQHRPHFAITRRAPRKTNSAPTVRLSHWPISLLVRKRSLNVAAKHASTRHHMVPVVTKVKPRRRNAITFVFDAGSMNCGRNARKKSATFGFRTFVRMPWRNAAKLVRRRNLREQTQMLPAFEQHFDSEKNEINATEQFDGNKRKD